MQKKQLQVIGYASCYGAKDQRCDTGPTTLNSLQLSTRLADAGFDVSWSNNVTPTHVPDSNAETLSLIINNCKELARQTHKAVAANKQIVVIGGDHSGAIGTWSGVHSALQHSSPLGLIWIDAHMDSHTPDSSISDAIHGMPVATLLGYGAAGLCHIESETNKIQPQNLCLVGVRSFEAAEAQLLNELGVKIFYMHEIQKLGLNKVLALAKAHVSRQGNKYGLSMDLDAIDPADAPGVGSPENHGISGKNLISALKSLNFGENFIGIEISELNSERDDVDKTARLAIEAILACLSDPQPRN